MKVYSATQFCGELDILDIRLNTLDPIVDYHIITESNIYWNGDPKPFYLEENMKRFEKFKDKIIYQQLRNENGDIPSDYINLKPEDGRTPNEQFVIRRVLAGDWWGHEHPPYGRDTFEKESVYLSMQNCQDDDMIILSDIDEIPEPAVVRDILDNHDHNEFYNFYVRQFYYYLNMEKNEMWYGPMMCSFNNFKNNCGGLAELKMKRRGLTAKDSGWHFTYMGGIDKIKKKIETFSEWYLNTDRVKDNIQNNIDTALTGDVDLFFRSAKFRLVPIEELPQYVIDHQHDIFKDMIYDNSK